MPDHIDDQEIRDAARRTRLANERTFLAWWRTGLTSIAVAVGLGRIVPGVSHSTSWPYEAVGTGYGALGICFMAIGYLRVRAVERAVDAGGFAPLERALTLGVLIGGSLLGVATNALLYWG